ncbi:tRNA wybutosine-synthesizing protein 2 homolog [Sardina pilchardus]|uniref:tRNA wybutosine-synthesizing protein 2 homolog n=1 Tax=Sardina pilchardus TaxID=27697 RepID=UPI002E12CE37
MRMVPSLNVPQRYGQIYRKHLLSKGALDLRYRIQKHSNGTVTLPLVPSSLPQLDLSSLQCSVAHGSRCEIVQIQAQPSKKGKSKYCSEKLVEAVQDQLSSHGVSWNEDLKSDLPQSWQRHGDLVVIGEDCFTLPAWKNIGTELWSTVAHGLGAKRLAQIKRISNDGFRTPLVIMLLGDSSHVTHLDNKIRYEFDITKCMFSFGNITEKLRIASFNCSGETVVDLYAGIGYFTLPYLVHAGAAHVYACEWNPDAVKALKRNLQLNRVSDRCTVHQGDNRQLPLEDLADRVNLGLIPSSEEGWPVACRLLRRDTGGVLHIHQNVSSAVPSTDARLQPALPAADGHITTEGEDKTQVSLNASLGSHRDREAWRTWAEDTATRFAELLRDLTGQVWRTHIMHIECVKSYAPHIHHIVLDLKCTPL